MITKFKNYLIKETPDYIDIDDIELSYYNDEAIPFEIITNYNHTQVKKVIFGNRGGLHPHENENVTYPGRLWLQSKIMSFWVYPNEVLFVDIIKKLEKKLRRKIFNNRWKIEVIRQNNNKLVKKEYDPNEPNYYLREHSKGEEELIPVEDYIGSDNPSEEDRMLHLMNWKEKQLAKKQGK